MTIKSINFLKEGFMNPLPGLCKNSTKYPGGKLGVGTG